MTSVDRGDEPNSAGERRLLAETTQTRAENGVDVFMQQAGIEQFSDQETKPAGRMKVIHIREPVRIHLCQQRHSG